MRSGTTSAAPSAAPPGPGAVACFLRADVNLEQCEHEDSVTTWIHGADGFAPHPGYLCYDGHGAKVRKRYIKLIIYDYYKLFK